MTRAMMKEATNSLTGVILGFDPGGSGREGNGVAAVQAVGGRIQGIEANHFATVDQAEAWFQDRMQALSPLALGVDTLLAWSGAVNGGRAADRALRAHYVPVVNSVIWPNGLYGAMSIGGPLLAVRLREHSPNLPLFETHPKVLYYAQTGEVVNWEGQSGQMTEWLAGQLELEEIGIQNEDEFDAVLSALAAMRRLQGMWVFDLYSLSAEVNEHLTFPTPGPMAQYPWFEPIPAG